MLSLGLGSLLFFFISYNLGVGLKILSENLLNIKLKLEILEAFFNGILFTFIFLNIVSLFTNPDYKLLIPLLFLSIYITIRYRSYDILTKRILAFISILKSSKLALTVCAVITVFFIYWIIPPRNADSGAYHYLTIKWYEQYKVIPGLANIHGRFAFNPASFIISAPYSFTSILHQSIYPLNGSIIFSFFLWICNLILKCVEYNKKLIFLIITALWLRLTLVNISSPSSDALAITLATYVMIKIYLHIQSGILLKENFFYLPLLIVFCITVKLSLLPFLIFIPLLFYKSSYTSKSIRYYTLFSALIIFPWLLRNFILCGYLFYPLLHSDIWFYSPDWKVPQEIIKLDRIYTQYGPYYFNEPIEEQLKLGFAERNIKWFLIHFEKKMFVELFLLLSSLLSPLYWIIIKKKRIGFSGSMFLYWMTIYLCVFFWIINSPDYRFGSPYLYMSASIPLSYLCLNILGIAKTKKIYSLLVSFLFPLLCLYYSIKAFISPTTYTFSFKDCWFLPLKDIRYLYDNDLNNFPKILLNDGKTFLYLSDPSHECINAPSPCMPWNYGTIKMRGSGIADGFRCAENKVSKHYPFVNNFGEAVKE